MSATIAVKVTLSGPQADPVRHLLPEDVTELYVEVTARPGFEGTVEMWWRGKHADGLPHKRRTSQAFGLSEEWWRALTLHNAALTDDYARAHALREITSGLTPPSALARQVHDRLRDG